MGTPANIKELQIAMSRVRQTNISTKSVDANLIRFKKLNASIPFPNLVTEDDSAEIGSGTEFPETVYKVNWDFQEQIEKYCSSQWAAVAIAMAMGSVSTAAAGTGYKHTCVPQVGQTAGIELPYSTFAYRIRTAAEKVIDFAALGCVYSRLELQLGVGPTLANSRFTATIAGSGRFVDPSGVAAWPGLTVENRLLAASQTGVILGEDYIAKKNLLSLTWSFDNAPDLEGGFFPGAGVIENAAVRGRLEYGDRVCALQIVARYDKDSTEWAKIRALTEGTAVIQLDGDLLGAGPDKHQLKLTHHRCQISSVQIGETNRKVDVRFDVRPLWHSTNGLVTAEITTDLPTVG